MGLIAGFILLFFEFITAGKDSVPDLCIFHQVTGLPCPSCGSTRSAVSLLHGDFLQALLLNPLGFVIVAIMLVAPFWLIFDIATGKDSLFGFYKKAEVFLRKRNIAIPLICFILANWIWNIYKGL